VDLERPWPMLSESWSHGNTHLGLSHSRSRAKPPMLVLMRFASVSKTISSGSNSARCSGFRPQPLCIISSRRQAIAQCMRSCSTGSRLKMK
jgi:hypothetical protein